MIDRLPDIAKTAIAGASLVIGATVGWLRMEAKIDAKADSASVMAVERELQEHLREDRQERRINRILLCRHPEIRGDSYCEGYR